MLVACCYGLIDMDEYMAEIKKRSNRTAKAKNV